MERCIFSFRKNDRYLRVEFTLGTIFANKESGWLVRLHAGFRKLRHFELMSVAHRR